MLQFYKITQQTYDKAKAEPQGDHKIDEDNIYVTLVEYEQADGTKTEGNSRIYNGEHLLGDSYATNIDPNTVISQGIGGLKPGTKLNDVLVETGGSISKILDNMICPNYAPVFYEPFHNTTVDTSTPYKRINDFAPIPLCSEVNASLLKSTNPLYSIEGSLEEIPIDNIEVRVSPINMVVPSNESGDISAEEDEYLPATTNFKFIAPGKVEFTYTIKCGQKSVDSNPAKDSYGNLIDKCAMDEGVLMSETDKLTSEFLVQRDPSDPDQGYILKARRGINPTTYTYYISPTMYDGDGSLISAEESYNMLSGEGGVIHLDRQPVAKLYIPIGYRIVGLYMESICEGFSVTDSSKLLVKQTTSDKSGYDLYKFGDKCVANEADYKLKIAKNYE